MGNFAMCNFTGCQRLLLRCGYTSSSISIDGDYAQGMILLLLQASMLMPCMQWFNQTHWEYFIVLYISHKYIVLIAP